MNDIIENFNQDDKIHFEDVKNNNFNCDNNSSFIEKENSNQIKNLNDINHNDDISFNDNNIIDNKLEKSKEKNDTFFMNNKENNDNKKHE